MSVTDSSSPFRNVSKNRLQQAIRDELLRVLRSGEYKAGARLPSEIQFSELLGVSRISVREALRWFEALGLIRTQRGRGSFLVGGPGEQFVKPFSNWLEIHRADVLDLMKVRGALDALAGSEAAVSAGQEGVAAIVGAQEKFRVSCEGDEPIIGDLVAHDVEFHLTIARVCGSPLLPKLLRDLNELLNESRCIIFSQPGRSAQSCLEHDAIVGAIAAGDADAARAAVTHHVSSSCEALI